MVFHLAAGPGHPVDAAGRAAMIQDTVVGTANLLEALRRSARGSSTSAARSSTATAGVRSRRRTR